MPITLKPGSGGGGGSGAVYTAAALDISSAPIVSNVNNFTVSSSLISGIEVGGFISLLAGNSRSRRRYLQTLQVTNVNETSRRVTMDGSFIIPSGASRIGVFYTPLGGYFPASNRELLLPSEFNNSNFEMSVFGYVLFVSSTYRLGTHDYWIDSAVHAKPEDVSASYIAYVRNVSIIDFENIFAEDDDGFVTAGVFMPDSRTRGIRLAYSKERNSLAFIPQTTAESTARTSPVGFFIPVIWDISIRG